jgi:predicted SAM-dependent methyltransferase
MRLPPSHPDGIRNLSVGCGPHHLRENFWNTDLREFKGIDEAFDAVKPWPYIGQLEHIYAEHFLEHLRVDQAIDFLVYAGLALVEGGHIRLSTPSLEWVLSTHFRLDATSDDDRIADTLTTNRAFHGWGHQFLYSKPFLFRLFAEIGYDDIRFCDYGKSEKETFAGIERHGGYSVRAGYPSVWIIEATRKRGFIMRPQKFMEKIDVDFLRHVRAGH